MSAPTADEIALTVRDALYAATHESERSLQSADFRLGPSDIGLCRERVRRMILQVPYDEPDQHYLAAFVGTAIGDHAERALAEQEGWITQQELTITLPAVGDQPSRTMIGHCDAIVPEWNMMVDFKSTAKLAVVARGPVKLGYQYQRHLYCLGAIQAGLLEEEGALVANVFIDRTAETEMPHVDVQPFSWDVVREAAEWLEDAIYAVRHHEEASKDPGIEFCSGWCGYYLSCRALDRKIEGGLIEDEEKLAAAKLYVEALADEKEAATRKAQAKRALMGVEGSTGEHAVKWIHVGPGEVQASYRPAYDRLSVTRLRKATDS